MRRRLFTLASAASLLLCVATVVLWVRSYLVTDAVYCLSDAQDAEEPYLRRVSGMMSGAGGIAIFSSPMLINSHEKSGFKHVTGASEYPDLNWSPEHKKWGFKWSIYTYPSAVEVVVPLWSVEILLLVVLPCSWALQTRKSVRRGQSCAFCRYNLTGNTSGVCPECGTAVAGKAGT